MRKYVGRIIAANKALYAEWLERHEKAMNETDPVKLAALGFIRREYDD